jgi:hypothetical protein
LGSSVPSPEQRPLGAIGGLGSQFSKPSDPIKQHMRSPAIILIVVEDALWDRRITRLYPLVEPLNRRCTMYESPLGSVQLGQPDRFDHVGQK